MEFFQLKQFYMTAKTGNMTKAAAAISIAQPALSKSIRNLETELNTPLFTRNNKGMVLTKQGEILMDYCEQIFHLVDNAQREIQESLNIQTHIKLCIRSGSEMMGNVFSTFVKQHPDVRLDISENDNGCDILIDSAFPEDLPKDAKVLLTEELCLAVSKDHYLANYTEIPMQALSGEKFITLSNSESFLKVIGHLFQNAHITPRSAYSCGTITLLQEMISLNMGISIAASINWAHSNPPGNIHLLHFTERPRRFIYYRIPSAFHSEPICAFENNLISHFSRLQKTYSEN